MTYTRGDIVLTGAKGQKLLSRVIRFGQRVRYGFHSPYTRFSHAALLLDEEGTIAEAQARGVRVDHIDKYAPADIEIIPTHTSDDDWAQIEDYLSSVLTARTSYGFTTILGLFLYCLTGSGLCIQRAGSAICSGFVCDALTRAGYVWDRPPFAMMPADIAKAFGPAMARLRSRDAKLHEVIDE